MDFTSPLEVSTKKATAADGKARSLVNFSSYAFERSMITAASAFRFTAEGVSKADRLAIRSGDTAFITAVDPKGNRVQVGVGIIDETDTHVIPNMVEYLLTGRDLLGQLVDNSSVDSNNQIVNLKDVTIKTVVALLIKDTRLPQQFKLTQVPNLPLLFQTNPGETKISSLQRYLDLANCLLWTDTTGRLVVGKPNFTQKSRGVLQILESNPARNNILEARVRRNLNLAIRKIVTQLSTLRQVDAGEYTLLNADKDMRKVASGRVGRSVYRSYSYGNGESAVNQITAVGNQSAMPESIGNGYSAREIARENMKVLDLEIVVEGHFGPDGKLYDIDQIYTVVIEDEDVNEDLMVYSVSYELTMNQGLITRMRLCRLWTICAFADQLGRVAR